MTLTLDQTNSDYFDLIRERTEQHLVLDCFKQTRRLLKACGSIHNCLDVGCASGYLYFHIRDLIEDYHGLDASTKFIEYGKEQFKKQGITNADHHCTRFENFQPRQKFDALICLGLFYVFPNYHWYLDEMIRMTKKVIIIRSLFAETTRFRYVPEMPGSKHWTYYNIYSTKDIEDFVTERNWLVKWEEDDYVQKNGGYYETAGMEFPFKFLILSTSGC